MIERSSLLRLNSNPSNFHLPRKISIFPPNYTLYFRCSQESPPLLINPASLLLPTRPNSPRSITAALHFWSNRILRPLLRPMATKRKSTRKAAPAKPTSKKLKTEVPEKIEPDNVEEEVKGQIYDGECEEEMKGQLNDGECEEEEEMKGQIDDEECEESDVKYKSKKSGGSRAAKGKRKDKPVKGSVLKSHQAGAGDESGKKAPIDESDGELSEFKFIGDPIPDKEARRRWPKRYEGAKKKKVTSASDDDKELVQAKHHYLHAEVDGVVYNLYDNAHVKAGKDEENYICRIVEFFEAVDGSLSFRARWFYRASDTVLKQVGDLIDAKRVFLSEVYDDNPLECLVQKLDIVKVPLDVDSAVKQASISKCNFYYDTLYQLPYSTFMKLPEDDQKDDNESNSTLSSDIDMAVQVPEVDSIGVKNDEIRLLDMYSGCGAMSTGLCLGANLGGVNLVTRWAVDINEHACKSLKLNHPETEVRNEDADNFLNLLKEWQKLCTAVGLVEGDKEEQYASLFAEEDDDESGEGEEEDNDADNGGEDGEVFEVDKILDICYRDPKNTKDRGLLHLKVSWKGYGPEEDTWEPIDGLSNCGLKIKEFVVNGYERKMLPLPGDVDVLCGGPPCQGISGFNRFRNKENPLDDKKNSQMLVYMGVVEYLKPRFVLMENVVDLVKFSNGYLGRYGLGRLLQMNYQVRMGIMAAGAYGLPQFRMRVFLWGARASESLPQYPLPTHNVVLRGHVPVEFENHTVAYDVGFCLDKLEKSLLLEDAISDLPEVGTYGAQDESVYNQPPKTDFQKLIRLTKPALMGSAPEELHQVLYDHCPLQLNQDDYDRVCQIPKKKGANFRDLPGLRVVNNKVERIPGTKPVLLKSGKLLVPDYAITFVRGVSCKPFARLWWDQTVPTVVTRAEPHNQAILHPVQDRVLTIRENARLQGFPDYYKLTGPVKERYIQVGNAVAVPVARALGYALSLALQGKCSDSALIQLPPKFSFKLDSVSSSVDADVA